MEKAVKMDLPEGLRETRHRPWPLQRAEGRIECNTMGEPFGLGLAGPPLLHFARRLEVVAWRLAPVRGD